MSTSSTAPDRASARAVARTSRRWGSAALAAAVAGVALQATPAHAVDAPVVTGPVGTVTGAVELTWNPVEGATQYEVHVDDKADFSSPEWRSTTVGTVSVPTSPLPSGEQYVQVRARVGSTWSAWAQTIFNVGPVAGPNLTAPAPGAALKQPGQPPVLRWTPVTGATSYTVEIDADDDFVGARTYTTKGASFVVPDNQAPGITYHWRVRATLATNVLSNVSDSRTYTVLPLDAPEMDTLNDVAITDVVLDWDPVPGAMHYELQVDDDYDFNSPEKGVPAKILGTRWSPPTTFGNDQYYWRVRAVDADGNPTAWTRLPDGEHHEFDRVWTDRPQLVHPVGSTPSATVPKVVGDDLYYEWTPVPQASHYEVWLSTDPNFTYPSSVTTKCQVVGTTYTPGEKGDACMPGGEGGAYYWKVRAMDLPYPAGVDGIFSETQLFVYEDSTHGAPGEAWQFDDSARGRTVDVPTADWEPVDNTAKYRIELLDGGWNVAQRTDTLSTSWTPPAKVDATKGPYRWQITAFDHDGHPTTTTTTSWAFNVSAAVTGSPAPLEPIDQPATYDAPNLRWGALAGADHYRVWVRDVAATAWYSSGYAPLTKNAWSYPAATDTEGKFLNEGTYEWFVEAYDELGNYLGSGDSSTFTVLPLTAVAGQRIALSGKSLDLGNACVKTLAAGATNWCDAVPSTPVLDWNPVSYAATYRVHVSRDANFTTGTLTDSLPETSNTRWAPRWGYRFRALPDSQASTAYYWYIQPCKANSLCGPDPRSTVNPARYAFRKTAPPVALQAPAHVPDPVNPTSVVETTEVTFTWEDYLATNRATTYAETGEKSYQSGQSYRIEVATDPTFATTVESVVVDQPTYTAAGRLYPEGTLYWRVQTIDAANNSLTWSETRTLVKRSPKPELLGPLAGDGELVTGSTPLRWAAQPYAASYDVQVAADEDVNFSAANLVVDKTSKRTAHTTGYQGQRALKPAKRPYVWRVRRHDAYGNKGPWSEVGRFMVNADDPAQTVPAADATVGQRSLVLRWEPVVATSRYRVSYRKRGETSVTSSTTHATAFSPTALLSASTAYEWRVEALDADSQLIGDSGWRAFTVGGTPTATTPATLQGDGRLGTRLTVDDPTWSVPGVRSSYEWQRDGVTIDGAVGSWYEVTPADVGRALRVKVTGTSPEFGTGTSTTSAVTGLPGPGPVATTQPRLTGSGVVGTTLTVSPVSWDAPGVTSSYEWLRNGRVISRATATTYTVTADDVGADLTARVSGVLLGRETTTVLTTPVVGLPGDAPTTESSTTLTGTPTVGSTLTAPDLVWNRAGVQVVHQWLRDGTALAGRTGRTYRLVDEDAGRTVSVRITTVLAGHRETVLTSPAVVVTRPAPTVTPTPTTGPTGTPTPTAGPTTTTSPRPTTSPTRGTTVSSKTSLGVAKKVRLKGKKSVRVTTTVKVTASGTTPRGTVKVYAGRKVVGTGTLRANGTVKIKLKALKRGTHKVKVTYLGKGTVKRSTSRTVKVKVVR